MAKAINWLAVLAAFVKDHPKTSATVAFNLGVFAAEAAKTVGKRGTALGDGARALGASAQALGSSAVEIPSKLIELVPSMKDLGRYVPLLGTAEPKRKPARRRKARRTTTAKAVSKTTPRARRKKAG